MKKSLTFRFIRRIGLNYSEKEYGNIGTFDVLFRLLTKYRNAILLKYCMYSVLLSPLNHRLIRPKLWRWMGCNVGSNIFIGNAVMFDAANAKLITLEDNVHIASHSILLCHQRDLSKYYVNVDYSTLPYRKGNILLKKGCLIGTGSIVMPGITVGEGAIIGVGSLVINDIPPWTIAVGRPAKVIRDVPKQNKI